MKFTQSLIQTLREAPADEDSINAQLLIRGNYIDKVMAGVYTYLPLGLRVLEKISKLIRRHMDDAGGVELLMPTLHPKKNYETTGRWETLDSLVRFTTHWTKLEYALGATHEEIVTPLLKKYIRSYKDLPKHVYQIQNKFRDEKRVKSGILRGREFIMKDFYSFHASEIDLDRFYSKMEGVYQKLFTEVGIGTKTHKTFASGGTFSRYSHEFQTECSAGEDLIHLCRKCDLAINKEIFSDQSVCPKCGSKDLEEVKSIEVGNIFQLKRKYSDPFDLTFTDEHGNRQPVYMGCYGIGLGRLLGTVVEVLADGKGIVWPEVIAPYQVHLVGLNREEEEIKKATDKLYETLKRAAIEVLYDDRSDVRAGEKFADADLIGCPWRVTVSKKTVEKGQYEIKRRIADELKMSPLDSVAVWKKC